MIKEYLRDKRNVVWLLFGVLIAIRAFQGEVRLALWVVVGAISAAILDALIAFIFSHKRLLPKSAVITGAIIGGVLNSEQALHVMLSFVALAILSKHVIRIQGQHIFNPANFALAAATLLGFPLTWNISSPIYIIIPVGLYLTYSLKKFPHVFGFLISNATLLAISGINPLLLVNWFFIFIMLIEPKTSGHGLRRGLIFGCISGITSFVVFEFVPQYDFLICSLLAANLANPLLNIMDRRFNLN